jgi:DNA-binding NarL/FixJ family response regulator
MRCTARISQHHDRTLSVDGVQSPARMWSAALGTDAVDRQGSTGSRHLLASDPDVVDCPKFRNPDVVGDELRAIWRGLRRCSATARSPSTADTAGPGLSFCGDTFMPSTWTRRNGMELNRRKDVPAPALAVIASDPITRDGVCSWFRASGMVRLLPPGVAADAEVTVLFAHQVTEETMAAMRQRVKQASKSAMKFVLVADRISEAELLRAVRYGLVGFVPRSQGSMDQVLQAVLRSREGQAQLPDVLVKFLIDQIRNLQENVLEPHGLDMAGFKDREIEVLRLLAEGMDTAGVAQQLNYSQRTIKNILAGLLFRLGLRNRTQAIVYAMRAGVI